MPLGFGLGGRTYFFWAAAPLALCGGALAGAYTWELPPGFPPPRVPVDNPMSEAKVRLGRYLFYDQRLSVNGIQSCASCHRQELAFTDGRATAVGATGEPHSRSAMSLVNVAYSSVLTWSDPGARSLEKQALIPMLSEHPVELGLLGREEQTLAALRAVPVYAGLFPQAFPKPPMTAAGWPQGDPFTLMNVAKALAAFERTIISGRSPWDRFHFAGEPGAISESAKRGELVFFTDQVGGCFRCHRGFNFSDATDYVGNTRAPDEFHNTALYEMPYPPPNLGIFEHTRKAADTGKFKTPTLRNVELTGPYMHDGSIATLEEVVAHYEAGGRAHGNALKDKRMTPLHMTDQNRADLLAFLRSLTDRELLRDPRFSDPW